MQYTEKVVENKRNLLIKICFDGKNYHGWQIQDNALTVQEVFQKALFKILSTSVDIKGCSRTDSGVHANMYCISVITKSLISCSRLVAALNNHLPHDIAVSECIEAPLNFHARYSCVQKEYIYKIWNNKIRNPFMNKYALHYWYPIDETILSKACTAFIGVHDFTSFCTQDSREIKNMERNISECEVYRNSDIIEFRVRANGFLYNMVRIMVGTLLRVAQNKIIPKDIPDIIKAKNRSMSGPTAPACGLYLNKVFYEGF